MSRLRFHMIAPYITSLMLAALAPNDPLALYLCIKYGLLSLAFGIWLVRRH
jgi:hypothetical protein